MAGAAFSPCSEGRAAFGELERAARDQIGALLEPLPEGGRGRLLQAMRTIETLLDPAAEPGFPYLLRSHQPGDLGWIVHRHGVLYADEYGFGEQFEALVAEIVAQFARHRDPRRERCWIAKRDGAPVGSVMLVHDRAAEEQVTKRDYFVGIIVEQHARGTSCAR